MPERVSAVARVAEVSDVIKTVSPEPVGVTSPSDESDGTGHSSTQALAVMPAVQPRLEQIAGKHAQRSMTLLIAARDVDQARLVVDRAAADAAGLPPRYPVRAYRGRLAILFALDFPILAMAFVAVTQVSPIIAAGSAIALSLGLVLAAHAAGARLRDLARHLPSWVRDLAALASSEIQRFDWVALDLDQWTAILGMAQRYPAPDKVTPDGLTVAGNFLDRVNPNETRPTMINRTRQRLDCIDNNQWRRRGREELIGAGR
jgi:hypothetical protein